MRPSKLTYYADFVVYPVVTFGLAAAALTHASWQNRTEWLGVAVAGFVIWTLLEYFLHRSVLHQKTYFAPMHGEHHATPLAFIGTPAWVSVSVLSGGILLPVWWWVGFNVADGLTFGVMFGYWWYGIVHHFIHHAANKSSPSYFNDLRAWHMRHHYSPKNGNFGVTTSIWDHVFGTAISVRDKAVVSQ
ncbi:MAG TPA: sterol desaturase family protein [Steroidobacteraceae bacterium]|jgi:sterol desaturase/sphingolipid hydroxylase (fatty acid hydroxylase superfamily)|nr:sterol desaturase family protein [Steroidobacteraceae bacterium]